MFDVAVIGCGPAGGTAANLLAKAGLRVAVIEKQAEPYPLPRAVHIDHEAMRIFQSAGLADRLAPMMRATEGNLHIGADGAVLRYMGTAGQPKVYGWSNDYFFYQPELEAMLRDNLSSVPNVDLRLGAEFRGLEAGPDCVTVMAGGEAIEARFVIACDGASSAARKSLGIRLVDLDFEEPWLVVDAEVDGPINFPDYPGLPADADIQHLSVMLCDPRRPTTVVPGRGNHRRWEFMLLPGEDDDAMRAPDMVERLIGPWVAGSPSRIVRAATYRFHGLLADRWQAGRVFLAGDAAHQTPPFFGQGMCHGLRDVANLAWKMKLVCQGLAPASILGGYQAEREPQVRSVIDTAITTGRYICELDPERAADRDSEIRATELNTARRPDKELIVPISGFVAADTPAAGKRFIQPSIDGMLLDDLTGCGFRLLHRPGLGNVTHQDYAELGGTVHEVGADDFVAWLDEHDADAVLVRPDHYVFGTARAPDIVALLGVLIAELNVRSRCEQALS